MAWVYHAPLVRPHASQFITYKGELIRGGCTIMGLAACDVISKGVDAWVLGGTPGEVGGVPNLQAVMGRIYGDALANKNCIPGGAARQSDMIAEAKRIALPVLAVQPYQEPMPFDTAYAFLEDFVLKPAKPYAVLAQWALGAALEDAISGKSDEAALKYHAGCIFGTVTDPINPSLGGFLVCDGDSPVINTRPAVYSRQTLAAAKIISLVAFDYCAARVLVTVNKPAPPPPVVLASPTGDTTGTVVVTSVPPTPSENLIIPRSTVNTLAVQLEAVVNTLQTLN